MLLFLMKSARIIVYIVLNHMYSLRCMVQQLLASSMKFFFQKSQIIVISSICKTFRFFLFCKAFCFVNTLWLLKMHNLNWIHSMGLWQHSNKGRKRLLMQLPYNFWSMDNYIYVNIYCKITTESDRSFGTCHTYIKNQLDAEHLIVSTYNLIWSTTNRKKKSKAC